MDSDSESTEESELPTQGSNGNAGQMFDIATSA